ncbi:MAG: TPM domain-containing protein [Rhodoferax sp.]|nr:TPM domain-containing protein [Rhodoferax sp.]
MRQRTSAAALRLAAAALCWLILTAPAWAQDVLPVPPLSGRVVDQTGTLTAAQSSALSGKLAAIEQFQGSQLVVLLVASTQPEDIASYAQRVADVWKIGRREVGDGLLIVVAKNDRKVRIEVAKTLEGVIPDLMAKRIINEQITPAFKAGDFAGGLNAAVDAWPRAYEGRACPLLQTSAKARPIRQGGDLESLLMFLFVGVPLPARFSRPCSRPQARCAGNGRPGAGGLGWLATASLSAGAIGVVAVVIVGVLGLGAVRRGLGRQVAPSFGRVARELGVQAVR